MGNNTMPEPVLEYAIGEFKGDFPNVPISAGVNMEELKSLDPDPMFVSLPVIPKAGAISKNGLLYDDDLIASVESQINEKRPGGTWGHLKEEDRSTAYPIPHAMWVGAKRVGESLWAKAYIAPGPQREHIRRLRAVNGKIATSIYGQGSYEATGDKGVRRLRNFSLESLDFAPPERAALQYGASPNVTSEFQQEGNPDMDKQQLIAELTVDDIPARLRDALVAEFRTQVSDRDTLIAELQTSVAEFRRREFDLAVDARVAELTAWQVTGDAAKAKLDSFRRTLKSRIVAELASTSSATGKPAPELVEGVVETIWADLQPLAETVRDALAGPPAIVAGKVVSKREKFEDTPEARAKARALMGI